MKRKMVVFDMDNTLLENRFIDACSSRYRFTQALDLLRQVNTDPSILTHRIGSFLEGRGKTELQEIAGSLTLVSGIIEVVQHLKERDYCIGIISDSYQLVTGVVAEKINADFHLANELVMQQHTATGEVIIPTYFLRSPESSCHHQVCKTNALRYICKAYHTRFEHCIVVGDSENDACMLEHAGMGVSFCTTSELVEKAARKHIRQRSFDELLDLAP